MCQAIDILGHSYIPKLEVKFVYCYFFSVIFFLEGGLHDHECYESGVYNVNSNGAPPLLNDQENESMPHICTRSWYL